MFYSEYSKRKGGLAALSLLLLGEVIYLVDDFCVFVLVLEVNLQSDGGTGEGTNSQQDDCGYEVVAKTELIKFIAQESEPKDTDGDADFQPVVVEFLGVGHFGAGFQQVFREETAVEVPAIIYCIAEAKEHEHAGGSPEVDGHAGERHESPIGVGYHQDAEDADESISAGG